MYPFVGSKIRCLVSLAVGMDTVQNRQISKMFGEPHNEHGHYAEQTDLQEVW